ncbi:hypothetical protein L6164_005272 [Bauhinia variegata]|uniref:Uncharacterized protein n=1 Tax=Bauhinia variegata TaxID=167791 RepID=A0ACB9PR97_BAUVA|nr:hypothetical protein L6164_005272 [Bauhinia variegata]
MLDGILGRGFGAKCKSLIKLTKSRIDVIRRKRKATEKFLKKDIADLLADGLEINAYKRAEGLISELTMSSCYDFIEQLCDFVSKHLSVLQKLSGCPEECREAVASLMFAAARFSDLPELRDLRQMFQERYGNSLECYVNQEFSANMNSRSPTLEKKVHLMQDIASEFSIKWDSKAFEKRMSSPSPFAQKKSPEHPNDRHRFHDSIDAVVSRDDHDVKSRSKRPKSGIKCDEVVMKRDSHDNPLTERQEVAAVKSDRGYWKEGSMLKPIGLGSSSHYRRAEQFDSRGNTTPQRESQDTATSGVRDFTASHGGLHSKSSANEPFAVDHGGLPERKHQKDETPMVKPYYNNAIPPPYVKPNSKQKSNTYGGNGVSSHVYNDGIPRSSAHDKLDAAASASERIQLGLDNDDQERQASRRARPSRHNYEKDLSVDEDPTQVPVLPKPKSSRRKHSKSRSSRSDASIEDTGVATRKSMSRKPHDSRRGLQILFDDEQSRNDEEERIIDTLLVHYSKKPTVPVPEKARRKSKSRHAHQMDNLAGKSLKNGSTDGPDETLDNGILPPRSVSLPHEQTSAEINKVFTRAASFQPDGSNAAKHVHPKLPDYDDLAARFAALRGR